MKNFHLLILSLFCVSVLFITACEEDKPSDPAGQSVASCEGCHSNHEHLKKVAEPYVDPGGGGCGGSIPHIEPYDAVYLGGTGYDSYKESSHYSIGCVGCHGGVDKTDDKKVAHSGDFIAKPSMFAQEKCGSCHVEETKGAKTNIHNGFGQMKKISQRMGLAGSHEFSQLPESMQEGYAQNCATCHASCGECHVNRPHAGGGGLINGHAFSKKPDMHNVCVTCHKTRGGHAFLGVASGTKPDVHQSKGFTCTSCHTKQELHGDGVKYDTRYEVAQLPQCTDCHSNIHSSNTYHSMHASDMSCQTCHSQSYNSCGSCHIGGEGARITSYQDFKIAQNPIKDIKPDLKWVTVRRTLSAPDSWEKFGVAEYTKFDAHPTYNYTSPHNIMRWTERTQVESGASCYANCHIKNEDGNLKNAKYYLFESDLLDWEVKATKTITVDGKLPSKWFN
ncbi:MAG: hypothetical protein WC313_03250 [Candidatus Kapaibacterium sp.]